MLRGQIFREKLETGMLARRAMPGTSFLVSIIDQLTNRKTAIKNIMENLLILLKKHRYLLYGISFVIKLNVYLYTR